MMNTSYSHASTGVNNVYDDSPETPASKLPAIGDIFTIRLDALAVINLYEGVLHYAEPGTPVHREALDFVEGQMEIAEMFGLNLRSAESWRLTFSERRISASRAAEPAVVLRQAGNNARARRSPSVARRADSAGGEDSDGDGGGEPERLRVEAEEAYAAADEFRSSRWFDEQADYFLARGRDLLIRAGRVERLLMSMNEVRREAKARAEARGVMLAAGGVA